MSTKPDSVGWPWLRTPAATRLLDRIAEDNRREAEEQRIRASNTQILTDHVSAWVRDPRRI